MSMMTLERHFDIEHDEDTIAPPVKKRKNRRAEREEWMAEVKEEMAAAEEEMISFLSDKGLLQLDDGYAPSFDGDEW